MSKFVPIRDVSDRHNYKEHDSFACSDPSHQPPVQRRNIEVGDGLAPQATHAGRRGEKRAQKSDRNSVSTALRPSGAREFKGEDGKKKKEEKEEEKRKEKPWQN